MVLGLFPNASFQVQKTVLSPGDCLCIYTDGITDIQDPGGHRFGAERLQSVLQDNHNRSAEEIFRGIQHRCLSFQQSTPAPDDKTLVILRRTGSADNAESTNTRKTDCCSRPAGIISKHVDAGS